MSRLSRQPLEFLDRLKTICFGNVLLSTVHGREWSSTGPIVVLNFQNADRSCSFPWADLKAEFHVVGKHIREALLSLGWWGRFIEQAHITKVNFQTMTGVKLNTQRAAPLSSRLSDISFSISPLQHFRRLRSLLIWDQESHSYSAYLCENWANRKHLE